MSSASTSKPRRQASRQTTSSRDSRSRRSEDSYASQSTAPTSVYGSPQSYDAKKIDAYSSLCSSPASSVETYASTTTSEDELYRMDDEDTLEHEKSCSIPPLPVYRREVVEPNVRPSSPQDFARLFPSLNRFTIRHDEFTPDGNMNLRVDTVVTGRRRTAIQLFHLRMYDLAKREFSLRRYCRDSGREVCSSKRKYDDEPDMPKPFANGRPSLQRSVSSAFRTLGGRRNSSTTQARRPDTSYSSCDGDDESYPKQRGGGHGSQISLESRSSKKSSRCQPPAPTNTIKLEFSNYARVLVQRRGGGKNHKHYDFEWWGHRYTWKRSVDKQLGLVSFHLVRDGNGSAPVAHIVPEMRSPSQIYADESAGGWVPPCFMWIADEQVVDAVTDVADVIMATGLIALVDDCIKDRWETDKVHRIPVPLTTKSVSIASMSPRAVMQQVFGRRHTDLQGSSPLRIASPITAY